MISLFEEQEDGSSSTMKEATVTNNDQAIVLVVEDNADMRQYIRRILSGPYEVIESEQRKEWVLKARKYSRPDHQ